jgi:hypothetical protein
MDRENQDYLESHQSEAELLNKIAVLEARNAEIQVDIVKVAEVNQRRELEIEEMRGMSRLIEEENEEVQR